MSSPGTQEQEQEFVVRVPNSTENKSFHVMKYNASNNIDFSTWSQVRMVRENNMKVFAPGKTDDNPKFGAGSAFGKDLKEEARRKKLGIITKKYRPEDQPWLLKIGGKTGRKYKGVREGGITDNTTYYVFTHGKDGVVQAYPLSQWYNFTPIIRYKTLDADEAEERFAQRGKILNKWAVMVNKKVKSGVEEEVEEPEEGEKKAKGKDSKKELKISDMDDWEEDDDVFGSDSEKEEDDEKEDKKKRSKDTKKKTKKKKDDNEAFEDSDDGDDEGREVDYMSDESSDSEDEMIQEANIKGVDQDEGLAKMLDSDSSSEDEEKKKEGEEEDKKKKKGDENGEGSGGKKKSKGGSKAGSKNSSRATTPTEEVEKTDKAEKRKAIVANILDPNAEPAGKKSRLEQFGASSQSGGSTSVSNNDAISEDTVRRYLRRRPMTTTDLLKKFRSKRTGIQNAQLVQLLAHILKKINPHKQKVKGVTYLSLKEN